jgi:hypothetical protein
MSSQNLIDYFNGLIQNTMFNINNLTKTYNGVLNKFENTSLAQIKDLTKSVTIQNNQIENEIKKYKNESPSVQNIKIEYQTAESDIIKTHNNFLMIIYYISVLFFSIILFFINKTTIYKNIGIIIILIIYPFLMPYIERFLYFIFDFIYLSFINNSISGSVYLTPDY